MFKTYIFLKNILVKRMLREHTILKTLWDCYFWMFESETRKKC